jgi:hypothetical protein
MTLNAAIKERSMFLTYTAAARILAAFDALDTHLQGREHEPCHVCDELSMNLHRALTVLRDGVEGYDESGALCIVGSE